MKKLILFAVIVFCTSFSVKAQLEVVRANPAMDTRLEIVPANPGIFEPAPIGGYSTGWAYISKPPVLSPFRVTIDASVFLLGVDGRLYEKPVTGEMVHIPSDWNGTFYGVTYPLRIPVTIEVWALTNKAGQMLQNSKGEIITQQKVTFF